MDKKKILFCIRGTMLLLPEASILSHSWLLATILRSDVPCDKVGDAFYLEMDANSFGLVYDILQGSVVVEELLLSDVSWNLLKVTADFLLCPEISAHCEKKLTLLARKGNMMEKDIIQQNDSIRRLEAENQTYKDTIQSLADDDMRVLCCDAYRTYRTGNRCGSRVLMIGGPCGCGEDQKKVKVIRIRSAEEVMSALNDVPNFVN